MHAVVKNTPAVVLACMEKFSSISSHTPQVRCVLKKKKGLLLASDFAAAFGGRGYTVRAIASNSHLSYMSMKKHLIIWGWINE